MAKQKCRICGKPITLVPSAAERARKYGGKPADYSKLFTIHSDCLIEWRKNPDVKLLRDDKP